jgi:SNF2 family DNA or RNA helicase
MLEVLETIHTRTQNKRDENGKKIPPEKTIIFSQFTTMLDLVEPFLLNSGIRYTRCRSHLCSLSFASPVEHWAITPDDGSMKPVHREEALEKIKTSTSIRVILISFKAGGTGKLPLASLI